MARSTMKSALLYACGGGGGECVVKDESFKSKKAFKFKIAPIAPVLMRS